MDLFNFSLEEVLSFFAVLVRYSVLMAVLPFVGDRMVPMPVKILLALAISIALYPALVAKGQIVPGEALAWGATTGGIVSTVALEAVYGLVLGYVARLAFEAIQLGGNLAGTFMGFGSANIYDPHQESQTQVVAQLQMTIAMLAFLALDGHHLMLRAALDSYRIVGLGKAGFGQLFSARLIDLTGQVFLFGLSIAAPVTISIFAVNVVFGVMARAMPQLNILALSMSVTALIGIVVMFLSMPQFQAVAGNVLERMADWMDSVSAAMASK